MVFCLCCTKGMPSVCESGPQWFLNNAEYAVCIHVSLATKQTLTMSLSSSPVFKTYLNDTCNVTFKKNTNKAHHSLR